MKEKKPCSFEGCDRPIHAQGLCPRHYRQWKRHGKDMSKLTPLVDKVHPKTCTEPGCDDPHYSHGYCQRHYRRMKKMRDDPSVVIKPRNTKLEPEGTLEKQCSFPGCFRTIKALGLCNGHYQQYMARGQDMTALTPLRSKSLFCSYVDPETGSSCTNHRQGYGYCQTHMRQFLKAGRDASKLTPIRKSPEDQEADQVFKDLLKRHVIVLARYKRDGAGERKYQLCLRLADLFSSGQNWHDVFQAATCSMGTEEIEDFIYGHMGKFCIRVAREVHNLRMTSSEKG